MHEERDSHLTHSDEVHFEDPDEVARWTQSLGVGENALQEAVAAVGTDFGRVYDYVMRSRTLQPR